MVTLLHFFFSHLNMISLVCERILLHVVKIVFPLGLEYTKVLTTASSHLMVVLGEKENPNCDIYSKFGGFTITGNLYTLNLNNYIGGNVFSG